MFKAWLAPAITIGMLGTLATTSLANGWHHRQHERNQWTGLAVGAAAVGIYGLATHQNGLAVLGALGAGYSAYRANEDRPRYYGYDRAYPEYRGRRQYDRWESEHRDIRRHHGW